jgi:TRAP-type C4-dicarboxylate transport system substrate-binding protein
MRQTLLTLTGALLGLPLTAGSAHAVKIRVQSIIPAKADEVVMLKDFADTVRDLTNGEVDIEVLPGVIYGS